MIFDGTTAEEKNVKSYWLASLGIDFYTGIAGFGPGEVNSGSVNSGYVVLFTCTNHWEAYERAIRPVVSLKSEITAEEIQKCDGAEEEWTGEGINSSRIEVGHVELRTNKLNDIF